MTARIIFGVSALAALTIAAVAHLAGNEVVAEACGDAAFGCILIAAVIPQRRHADSQASPSSGAESDGSEKA